MLWAWPLFVPEGLGPSVCVTPSAGSPRLGSLASWRGVICHYKCAGASRKDNITGPNSISAPQRLFVRAGLWLGAPHIPAFQAREPCFSTAWPEPAAPQWARLGLRECLAFLPVTKGLQLSLASPSSHCCCLLICLLSLFLDMQLSTHAHTNNPHTKRIEVLTRLQVQWKITLGLCCVAVQKDGIHSPKELVKNTACFLFSNILTKTVFRSRERTFVHICISAYATCKHSSAARAAGREPSSALPFLESSPETQVKPAASCSLNAVKRRERILFPSAPVTGCWRCQRFVRTLLTASGK